MVSNGLVNTVGVNLTHRPINRFTFSGRRITFFAPARLVDSCSSQAVEFSTAITRCSRVHIQIVTVGASKMGDIFSLPATDTLRAFFFHCIVANLTYYIFIYSCTIKQLPVLMLQSVHNFFIAISPTNISNPDRWNMLGSYLWDK